MRWVLLRRSAAGSFSWMKGSFRRKIRLKIFSSIPARNGRSDSLLIFSGSRVEGRLSMISFWEVIDRAVNTGSLMKINEFEKRLYKKASVCVKKYEIRYDPDTPVVSDDDMIS